MYSASSTRGSAEPRDCNRILEEVVKCIKWEINGKRLRGDRRRVRRGGITLTLILPERRVCR